MEPSPLEMDRSIAYHPVSKTATTSDIDLLVEFDEQAPVKLLGFVALERELGKLVGQKVDLVEKETLKPVIGKRILEEVIPI